jgi:2-polyprenyl-3-methyl-5-hydroxy-6-metoxy-1,4-benzoquinol methylase
MNMPQKSESTDYGVQHFGEYITYSRQTNGIFTPSVAVVHRDDEYDSRGFGLLRDIQSRHFWYQGRHRFLLEALKLHLPKLFPIGNALTAIDLGGGCGGWITFLQERLPDRFTELALSDSSLHALELAGSVVGEDIVRYQTDLLRLGWRDRWDAAFLLDVLEHIPGDTEVLLQIRQALKPGGVLFVTTPALKCFRSYNDEIARHVRRYAKGDFARLAKATGMRLLRASYFMFFLSPLLVEPAQTSRPFEYGRERNLRPFGTHSSRTRTAAQYSNEPRFRSGNPARAMDTIPVGHLYPWCLSKAVLTNACSRNPI